ncbi:hypothetical protein [Photorhabdus antumapuensis]|uniref:hypothetical protein n=1 Tax=Photorhabdus antumapuensis TaxID=2862867 RepID=UPI001CEC0B9B|nr:hypothetical protein [Photorhabdus antumapuensis]MCA6220321.1 hypothetical protein [Photorhabdus antumapuensis]
MVDKKIPDIDENHKSDDIIIDPKENFSKFVIYLGKYLLQEFYNDLFIPMDDTDVFDSMSRRAYECHQKAEELIDKNGDGQHITFYKILHQVYIIALDLLYSRTDYLTLKKSKVNSTTYETYSDVTKILENLNNGLSVNGKELGYLQTIAQVFDMLLTLTTIDKKIKDVYAPFQEKYVYKVFEEHVKLTKSSLKKQHTPLGYSRVRTIEECKRNVFDDILTSKEKFYLRAHFSRLCLGALENLVLRRNQFSNDILKITKNPSSLIDRLKASIQARLIQFNIENKEVPLDSFSTDLIFSYKESDKTTHYDSISLDELIIFYSFFDNNSPLLVYDGFRQIYLPEYMTVLWPKEWTDNFISFLSSEMTEYTRNTFKVLSELYVAQDTKKDIEIYLYTPVEYIEAELEKAKDKFLVSRDLSISDHIFFNLVDKRKRENIKNYIPPLKSQESKVFTPLDIMYGKLRLYLEINEMKVNDFFIGRERAGLSNSNKKFIKSILDIDYKNQYIEQANLAKEIGMPNSEKIENFVIYASTQINFFSGGSETIFWNSYAAGLFVCPLNIAQDEKSREKTLITPFISSWRTLNTEKPFILFSLRDQHGITFNGLEDFKKELEENNNLRIWFTLHFNGESIKSFSTFELVTLFFNEKLLNEALSDRIIKTISSNTDLSCRSFNLRRLFGEGKVPQWACGGSLSEKDIINGFYHNIYHSMIDIGKTQAEELMIGHSQITELKIYKTIEDILEVLNKAADALIVIKPPAGIPMKILATLAAAYLQQMTGKLVKEVKGVVAHALYSSNTSDRTLWNDQRLCTTVGNTVMRKQQRIHKNKGRPIRDVPLEYQRATDCVRNYIQNQIHLVNRNMAITGQPGVISSSIIDKEQIEEKKYEKIRNVNLPIDSDAWFEEDFPAADELDKYYKDNVCGKKGDIFLHVDPIWDILQKHNIETISFRAVVQWDAPLNSSTFTIDELNSNFEKNCAIVCKFDNKKYVVDLMANWLSYMLPLFSEQPLILPDEQWAGFYQKRQKDVLVKYRDFSYLKNVREFFAHDVLEPAKIIDGGVVLRAPIWYMAISNRWQ